MKRSLQAVMAAAALVAAGHAAAQITLYEHDGFRGRAITIDGRESNLNREGFNDRASSIVVERGRWEVCEDVRFQGRCFILRRGNYPSLHELGLNDRISSVRPVEGRGRWQEIPPPVAYAPPPVVVQPAPQPVPVQPVQPAYDWRARPGEQVFEVPVSSVHAVVGPPNQRCWVERQPVQGSNDPNIGGALIGGIVGGILGHQIGGGSGKDLATAGGAVAGAVVGSNVANQGQYGTRDVQRCENVANTTPAYYDVTYFFNGTEHHVQTTQPPGRVIRVNGYGEPRQ
jgi:uncharacterized protein YcfJ